MVLKKEFNVDLSKMSELYKIKETDLLNRVTEREIEVGKLQKGVEEMMNVNKKLEESMTALQSQSMRIKKQVYFLLSRTNVWPLICIASTRNFTSIGSP